MNALLSPKINNVLTKLFATGEAKTFDATGAELATGTWTSESSSEDNTLTIKIAGQAGVVIEVDYAFNDDRQLTIGIPLQGGITTALASIPVTGQIQVSDEGNLTYQLTDYTPAGGVTLQTGLFHLYGKLLLDTSADLLSLVLNRTQVKIVIQGDSPASSKLGQTASGAFADQFIFDTTTYNTYAGGVQKEIEAKISFHGVWDLIDHKLVFITRLGLAPGQATPSMMIAIGGHYRGVSGGIEVYMSPNGASQLMMTVNGTHKWDKTTGEWNLNLGYVPGKSFKMDMSVKGKPAQNTDGSLSFEGDLSIDQTVGGPMTIDFKIAATCGFKNGSFTVTAQSHNGNYELEAEGTFTGKNYNITFDLKYSTVPGAQPISFSLGSSITNGALKANLKLIFGPQGLQADFSITISYPYDHSVNPASLPASITASPVAATTTLLAAAPVSPVVSGPLAPVAELTERIYTNKTFTLRKLSVYTLPGITNYLFKAKITIDADGAPKAYHPKNDSLALDYLPNATSDSKRYIQGTAGAQGPAKGFYVSQTTLQFGPDNSTDSFVDATTVPYFILPAHWRDVQPGDLGVIINWSKKDAADIDIPYTAAIFADTNPYVGEASIRAGQNLGLKNYTAKDGGDDLDNYIYIIFPGTALSPKASAPHWPEKDIKTAALALFEKMGGIAAVRKLF